MKMEKVRPTTYLMQVDAEKWKPVSRYEDRYFVSSYGRIFSIKRNRTLNPTTSPLGYKKVGFSKLGKTTQLLVHRLVLQAFSGNPKKGHQGAHLDGNPSNNNINNLKWSTVKENNGHKELHGTSNKGERNCMSKLKNIDVVKIKRRLSMNETQTAIAADFGVSKHAIFLIAKGKAWKHVAV